MAASYLLVAIGIAGAIAVTVLGEIGALVVGTSAARVMVSWVERRVGLVVLATALVASIARTLGH